MEKLLRHLWVVALFSFVALAGCLGGTTREEESPKSVPKSFYLDANLDFTIEYPRMWTKSPPLQDSSVVIAWHATDESFRKGGALSIIIFHHNGEGLETSYARHVGNYPGFTLAARKAITTDKKEIEAVEFVGHTPGRVFLFRIVLTNRHAYIVEASAPPEYFDIYRSLFEELIASFSPLN